MPTRQPKTVWSVAFACVIAFMGIGLVDPILKPIADDLSATPSQVALLFTSYNGVMAVAMLITGFVSSRLGAKRTLLLGLAIIVVGAGLAGAQNVIPGIVAFRALCELEEQILLRLFTEYGTQVSVVGTASRISPKQFYGLDVNENAVVISDNCSDNLLAAGHEFINARGRFTKIHRSGHYQNPFLTGACRAHPIQGDGGSDPQPQPSRRRGIVPDHGRFRNHGFSDRFHGYITDHRSSFVKKNQRQIFAL